MQESLTLRQVPFLSTTAISRAVVENIFAYRLIEVRCSCPEKVLLIRCKIFDIKRSGPHCFYHCLGFVMTRNIYGTHLPDFCF
jgi:hypothetical protein